MSLRRLVPLMILPVALAPLAARADEITRDLSGTTAGGQPVSFQVIIAFTPTGGDFAAGAGTATASFTLENTSGLFPFQSPAPGNPALSGFFFNVPPGAALQLLEARILAGAEILSTGTTVAGDVVPRGCQDVPADRLITDWYVLENTQSTGQYGIFTNTVETVNGVRASLVDPEVLVDCVKQGPVFAPLVVAGRLRYTVALSGLGVSLRSAADFLTLCSTVSGERIACALGGKFQATDADGSGSAFVGDPCQPTPARPTTWGTVKAIYR